MDTLLILLDVNADGQLSKPALEVVQAALKLSQSLNLANFKVGLVGAACQEAANQIARCGASVFLAVSGAEYQMPRYASDAAAAEALCRAAQATIVLAPANSRWLRVLAGVAYRLGGRMDSHVAGLSVANNLVGISRWYYRQRMEAALQRVHRPWIIALDPGAQPAWTGPADTATLNPVPVTLPAAAELSTVTGVQSPPDDVQTIRPDASLLFVAGAGWTKKQADGQPHTAEAQQLILDCLRLSHASLGGTKSIVDLSSEGQSVLPFMTHLNQVGQTGSTPRHPKGLATCCHGEEPHVVGWRFIKERRVVNLDPNCSWTRGKADVVYVADAFQVVAKINQMLQG
jgi:electron transfer flavoprotein alpha subunit